MRVNIINAIEFDIVSCFLSLPKLFLLLPMCLLVFKSFFFLLHEMFSVNLVFGRDLN